jgi:hypothetical protein
MVQRVDWKQKTIIIGAIVGTLCGLVAAYILIQRAEQQNAKPQLSAGDGVKIGLGVLGVLRLVADFANKKK